MNSDCNSLPAASSRSEAAYACNACDIENDAQDETDDGTNHTGSRNALIFGVLFAYGTEDDADQTDNGTNPLKSSQKESANQGNDTKNQRCYAHIPLLLSFYLGYSCKVRTCYKILYPRVTKRANMLYAKTISFYSGPHFATNTFIY